MPKPPIWVKSWLLVMGIIFAGVGTASAATITVTTNNDILDAAGNCAAVTLASLGLGDGLVSLREAICAANNNPGPDNIEFAIPGAGVHTIRVTTGLPPLTDNETTINGYTQDGAYPNTESGGPATIMIEIDGTGTLNNGLNVTSTMNVIRGLAIFGFLWNEIAVFNYEGRTAAYNLISGNYLGTNAAGTLCPATENKGFNGVFIGFGAHHNLIGGGLPPNLNLISCNGYEGVGIHGAGTTDNIVSANYIGTDPPGTMSRGNGWDGVRIYGGAQNNTIGGATWGERNVISGNARDGIRIIGAGTTGNRVLGNYIGTEPDGVNGRSNDLYGVHLLDGAQDNTIGGDRTAGEGNVISGNLVGVVLSGAETMNNTVSGNLVGLAAGGGAALGNSADGIGLMAGANGNLIGGDNTGTANVISGNGLSGILITDNGTMGNTVSGNLIGLSPDGTAGLGNTLYGVELAGGAQENLVGGNTAGARNLISSNQIGIMIHGSGTNGNRIQSNFIGTDITGHNSLGNWRCGVQMAGGAQGNTLGGNRETGEGNLISGNHDFGVFITEAATSGNVVAGNIIGLAVDGTTPLPNDDSGVHLGSLSQNNTIGGSTAGRGNIISGNSRNGIGIEGSGNFVSGNIIGLAGDGTTPRPNAQDGLHLGPLAQNNTVGGTTTAQRNLISGNTRFGMVIEGSGNIVSGNYIGTDASGATARGNGSDGLYLSPAAQGNLIGGDTPGVGNLVSGNGDDGISLDGASGNRIRGNLIGTNAAGNVLLGEADFGIVLSSGAQNNIIGGDHPGAGNVIAGCRRDGMYMAGASVSGNVIAHNRIGTDISGTLDLGNGQSGIELDVGAHGNVIGPGNIIAYNGYPGIDVDNPATIGNTITQNSIFSNTDRGIYLSPGAHGGILPPVIVAVSPRPITVSGTACAGCTVELFGSPTNDGQGRYYLGSAVPDGSGAFSLPRTSMPYPYLTATATDGVNGTSEFSGVLTTAVVLVTHLPLVTK